MVTTQASLRGAVYDDDGASRRTLENILKRCGFDVVLSRKQALDLRGEVGLLSPDVIVLELAQVGTRGLALMGDVRAAAPGSAIVLVGSFATLRAAALAAGAYDLVDRSDLRQLERCLRRLRAEKRGAIGVPATPVSPGGGQRTT